MKTTEFTEYPPVFQLVRSLKEDKINEKQFSDVLDGEGHQYVELVMEGGGVLGVALIGYTYVLEQMGLRFFSLAGTSAGSINAMLLACIGDISSEKSDQIIQVLANKNLYDFVDGDKDAKDFIQALVEKAKTLKLAWRGMQVIDNLTGDLGLNPGDDFYNWLAGILRKEGIKTTADLMKKVTTVPPTLMIRPGIKREVSDLRPRLALIAADLTTETKVEFPKMNKLYWKDPESVNPANFVRASMSIPYFFKPLTVKNLPSGKEALINWVDLVDYYGKVPDEVFFVDGGLLSNFPIDVFHNKKKVPRMPTFGARLGIDRNLPNKITNPMNLFSAMFNSIRHLHDYDFILQNPDYKQLVTKIEIGNHDWLNFGISKEDKIDLFYRGARSAAEFLRNFNWRGYKLLREDMIDK